MMLNQLEPQPFSIGDRVLIKDDGGSAQPHIVMGVRYEHRMVPNHGWDIWVVAEEGFEHGEGGFDGFSPDDLVRAHKMEGELMAERYPYRHQGPAVHGSKLADYLISEVALREDRPEMFGGLAPPVPTTLPGNPPDPRNMSKEPSNNV